MGHARLKDSSASRTMNHKMMGDVLFIRHRSLPVGDNDWEEMIAEMDRYLESKNVLRVLVKTDDAGPNAAQRQRLNRLVASRKATMRVAVMSTSVLVRGIVTAFSWARALEIKSFGENDMRGALAFLGAPEIPTADAWRVFSDIEETVG